MASHVIADTRCWEGAAVTFNFHSVQLMPQRLLRNHNYCNSINNVPIVSNDTMLVFSHIFQVFTIVSWVSNILFSIGGGECVFVAFVCLFVVWLVCIAWVALSCIGRAVAVAAECNHRVLETFQTTWTVSRQPRKFPDHIEHFQMNWKVSIAKCCENCLCTFLRKVFAR